MSDKANLLFFRRSFAHELLMASNSDDISARIHHLDAAAIYAAQIEAEGARIASLAPTKGT